MKLEVKIVLMQDLLSVARVTGHYVTCDRALPYSQRGERRCSALRMAGGARGKRTGTFGPWGGGGGVGYLTARKLFIHKLGIFETFFQCLILNFYCV